MVKKYSVMAALAMALALTLGACGGGGSSTATMMPEMPAGPTLEEQRTAISTAIAAARTAVAGIGDASTDAAVAAARGAIAAARAAISGAGDVPAAEKAANTVAVNTIAGQLTAALESRTAAMAAAATAEAMAMAATGKALYAALAGPAAENTALDNITTQSLTSAGLAIDAANNAGALESDPESVTLEAGASAGSLGSWMGMDYSLTEGTGENKVTNEARVYTNQGAPTSTPFGEVHTVITEDGANKGYLAVDVTAPAEVARVMAAAFTHSGTQNHPIPARSNAFYVRGTYDGAPGEYRCTGTCTSTNDGSGAPSGLGGTWHFKPDAGAMVSQPDAHYLYFGWWVSKDEDGGPTAASAFAGRVGTDDDTDGLDNGWSEAKPDNLTGSATYAGHAAGKFAMNNPLDGTGNGGHFTADAMLSAKFSGDDPGITGTIDNFRLNDGSEDPGWSVSLALGAWGVNGAITAPASDPTVWTINGNAAVASGTWSGQMYDEAVDDNDDGSNIPTTVTGTFYSEFSTIGRMVGGFGANKQ